MTRTSKTVVSLASSVCAILAGTVVAAANSSYYDSISGAELPNATTTEGRFVGVASGSLPGDWSIDVRHDVLSSTSAVFIDGGSFQLNTVINWRPVSVVGYFPWHQGYVTQLSGFTGCGNQRFAVSGSIAGVGINGGSGYGYFSATLTHYRTWVWWVGCDTYSATVTGSVSLSF